MKKIFLLAMDCTNIGGFGGNGHINNHNLRKVLAKDEKEAKKIFLKSINVTAKDMKREGWDFAFCQEIDTTTPVESFGEGY